MFALVGVLLVLGGVLLLACIGSLLALSRTREVRELAARVEALEAALRRLREGLSDAAASRAAAPATTAAPPSSRAVAPAATVPHAPPIERAPSVTPPPPVAPPSQVAPPLRQEPPRIEPPRIETPPPAPEDDRGRAIDWEQWIGIRGAAIAGALVLGLAGFFLFRYTLERGLITPRMRVIVGLLSAVSALASSRALRLRGYVTTGEALAGAGVTLAYASIWAAHVRYALIGAALAYGSMVLITLLCGWLSVRRSSLTVAVLGLIGGFATPLLLSSGADRPFGLFGYVLLLDAGLFVVARRGRWPILALLGLGGTVLLEGLWIFTRMDPGRLWLALLVLGGFAALFALALGRTTAEEWTGSLGRATQLAAVLFPFTFALYFAWRVDLGQHFWPIALLMAVLGVMASQLERDEDAAPIALGAAVATVAVSLAWVLQQAIPPALAWEVALIAVGLSAVYHVPCELGRREASERPAMAIGFGMFAVVSVAAAGAHIAPWPWLASWAALAAMLYRLASLSGRAVLRPAAAIAVALGLSLLQALHEGRSYFLGTPGLISVLIGAPAAASLAAWIGNARRQGSRANEAVIALASVMLIGLALAPLASTISPWLVLGTLLAIGVIAYAATASEGKKFAFALPAAVLWAAQNSWLAWSGLTEASEARAAFVMALLAVVVTTLWPLFATDLLFRDPVARYAAALAGPLWFPALRQLFKVAFGTAAIGLLPLLLGALASIAVLLARGRLPAGEPTQRSAYVWFGGVALSFAAIAVPMQLEREWITIGWALQGLAILALWRRLDHPGLKYFALALFAAATVRLVANPALLEYYPRPELRVLNWLLYTYLVPAAALLGGASLLRSLEVGRARPWEHALYESGRPLGALASGLAAIGVIFVWINLAIAESFATGPWITLTFGQRPSQRLVVSIAWALYALVLLGFGMVRASPGLRWLSLGLLSVTLIKVFLYDLGSLRDLYLVASLSGLAVSLILVSLLYQRFVFRAFRARGSA